VQTQPAPPPLPPVQYQAIQQVPRYKEEYELAGLPPTIFTGKRTDSNRFLKEFRQWRLLNRGCTEMKQAYNWVLMALMDIKGPKVNDWQEGQLTQLENSQLAPDNERLWNDFEQNFKSTLSDSNKKQEAYDRLITLHMNSDDIDTYIATFNNLITKTGWTRGEETADVFHKGLNQGTIHTILNRPTWPTTLDEWQNVAREEIN
jgi:Retrotransposon gag protein